MKPAALGVQMHSGWGVLVAVSRGADSIEILDRRRIVVADPEISGAIQPYHHASHLEIPQSAAHIARCAAASTLLAVDAVGQVIKELEGRQYRIVGCAVLLASGRPLPPLAKILASHPLIHTAEGEFFRQAASQACEHLHLAVTAIREKELDERAKATFGKTASRMQHDISSLGSSIGPPWTKDHKTATLAAMLVLAPIG
jgi:hypothetical protein